MATESTHGGRGHVTSISIGVKIRASMLPPAMYCCWWEVTKKDLEGIFV